MYTLLIVDDDQYQLKYLADIIRINFQNIFTVIEACDFDSALEGISKFNFDIFILDINLSQEQEEKNGITLGMKIRTISKYFYSPIIYITAMIDKMQVAINELHCFSYILKPSNDEDIIHSIVSALNSPVIKEQCISFDTINGDHISITESAITYIDSNEKNINIHTCDNFFQTKNFTLEKIESLMLHSSVRCHKKYIVNIKYINNYDRTNRLIRCNNVSIPIGRSYKLNFENKFNNFTL